ncbi:putative ribosomal RNA small subunit methyltransferase B [Mobiluncus mulieris ATCC 35239]|uniref:Ribosomal RNA small subunit methyltransferase B n=2 Tax=Mobiluncus mulieris TaxID=2052 RepID=E0QRJ6_9ACTO|nr:transcription antitermination factor NusB [Mobiluncus mulieris]EFM45704.1 putative ribosomal RNA small subunit methyltransferase B [Mobiluncus mulieris ATCC 35239]MCU9970219.1 16S rRNA methyltransferase [Mobiluncus mulieris]MCU9974682.1 16S rRNA methyltransferase [Mobiluncus mulieris]MCU9993707.1 16S rRNA methyltransferase [Mobiluncus mulieris]MCV0013018.1 16S rRNA methyltransferase [Mobiluncus mulieris]
MNQRSFRNPHTGYQYRAKTRRDQPRDTAFWTLHRVAQDDAFANLVLPNEIERHHLNRRDAAFATELAYGTLRLQGRYDAIIARLVDRDLGELDADVLTVLRLGCHELLGMRVESYAAVDSAVDLARDRISTGPAGMVNAVLRRVSEKSLSEWLDIITENLSEEKALAVAFSYPEWMIWALRDSLVAAGRAAEELPGLLNAQNTPPYVALCARPSLCTADELATAAETYLDVDTRLGRLSPHAVVLSGGDPRRLRLVTRGYAGVEDEGSQFLVEVLTAVEVPGVERTWVDLCAGPGGKTALLAALAKPKDVAVVANEIAEHRVELVRDSVKALAGNVTVIRGDGREFGSRHPGKADRVLVDAPCSGLGALRRRPEARWRKNPADFSELSPLQADLLISGIEAAKAGGVVAYATCSPHLAETRALVNSVLQKRDDLEVLDAVEIAKQVALDANHDFGSGSYLQLWPDRDHTDAMFLALLRKKETDEN